MLYWLVQEPAVPLKVRASMQMEPPAVTCPATHSRACCMLPGSSLRLSMHNAMHTHSDVGAISASAKSEPQQDRAFWAKPNTSFAQLGTQHTAHKQHVVILQTRFAMP